MIINRVVLHDFGAFRGRHEIDLRPRAAAGRPIILFGGKNGAGKTTIFEAIRVCLYGLNALPGRQRRADYEKFLIERIHRHTSLPVQPRQASVEIEFEYAHLGNVSRYTVRRTWEAKTNGAQERLACFRDGKPLDDVEADQWQDFIKDLVPPGLSQLFFFDGEKIEELASHGTEVAQFRESFRSLLGLDLIEKLQDDLTIHITRQEKNSNADSIERNLVIAREEITKLEEAQLANVRERSQAENRAAALRSEVRKLEARLASEGGSFASRRTETKARIGRIEEEIHEIESRIREMANGFLPLAFSPEYLTRLEDRLLEEAELVRIESARDLVRERQERARRMAKDAQFWRGLLKTAEDKKEATKRVNRLLNELSLPAVAQAEVIHGVSEAERAKLLTSIRQAKVDVPKELASHTKKLEKLHRERRKLESALRRAPQEDAIAPLLAKLKESTKELGAAEARLKQLADESDVLKFKLNAAKRQEEIVLESLGKAKGVSKRIEVAVKTRAVLDKYLARVTEVKLAELSETLATAFSELSNKPGYYARVEIDAETFETTLYTRHGDRVTRDQLSAGERQIFATSLLWALAKTSGRPLPFIIDTPLGRLDHSHRRNLVENFFPRASHQVIILSTDAEIEGRYYEILAPHMSHGYTLSYDAEAGETLIDAGYSFDKAQLEVAP